MKEYLTESGVEELLNKIYPTVEFIRNRKVPNSKISHRPDYRSDELMLIVEFDGYQHYSNTKTQMNDALKRTIYSNMGYKIVNIPYFIQPSTESIKFLFGKDVEYEQKYPHGFVDDAAMLPADFNSLGVRLFRNQISDLIANSYEDIALDIFESLMHKILIDGKDILEVLPCTLKNFETHYLDLFREGFIDPVTKRYFYS